MQKLSLPMDVDRTAELLPIERWFVFPLGEVQRRVIPGRLVGTRDPATRLHHQQPAHRQGVVADFLSVEAEPRLASQQAILRISRLKFLTRQRALPISG